MRPDSIAQLMRAAFGDAVALAACMRNSDDLDRLAALVLLDPEPHPLATLTAFAVTRNPPAALRARMRAAAPAALRALHDAPDNDLVAVLRSRMQVRNVEALMDDLAPPSVLGDARALAGLARLSARCAAAVWSKAGADAAPDSGDGLSLDDRRVVLARAVTQRPDKTADLIERIDAEGWECAPDEARQAILNALAYDPWGAAWSGVAWGGMRPDERVRIASAAARSADAAASLITIIGAEGWRIAPDDARTTLLAAVTLDAQSAAKSGAAWGGMRPDERLRLARIVALRPSDAAGLIAGIGAKGWECAPDDARTALLAAVTLDAQSAAKSGAAWGGMRPDERVRLAIAAARSADAAADLIERIGANGWASAPDDARQTLLDAVANKPQRAAKSGAAWGGMRPDERTRLARAAAQPPPHPFPPQVRGARRGESAASLIERIGADGWMVAPEEARRTLLDAVANDPWSAAKSSAAWFGMHPDERALLARSAAQRPESAADLIGRIGAGGWEGAPDDARSAILAAVTRAPHHALKTLLRLVDRLDSEQRAALGFAALGGASAVPALAQALAGGCSWRDWMAIFLPAAIDDAEVRDAWRAALRSLDPASLRQALSCLPHTVAVALAPQHRTAPPR